MINKKIKFLLIIISSALFVSNLNAQNILTPQEAVKIALEKNYSIQIAKNQNEISNNNYSYGKASFFPTLDADAAYTKSNTDTKQKFFDGRTINRNGAKSNNLNSSISLNWTIFDGLQMFAAFDKLKELRKAGAISFKSAVESNILNVLSTYYNIVRQQQLIDVTRRSITLSKERVKIAQEKKEVGSGSKFDLLSAQVDLNDDKSTLLKSEQDLSALKIKLNQLLGRTAGSEFNVLDTIVVNNSLALDNLKTEVEKKNSDLLLAKQNKSSANIDLRLAESEWYPTVNLNMSYNFVKSESEAGYLQSNQNQGINYGITASFNLFNGLDTKRKIENAKISIKNSEYSFSQTKDSVYSNLLNNYRQYKNSLELVNLEIENLNAAEENVDIALERLRLGNITPLDFREAQVKMLTTKSNLVDAEYQAKAAELQLLKLSGRLITSD